AREHLNLSQSIGVRNTAKVTPTQKKTACLLDFSAFADVRRNDPWRRCSPPSVTHRAIPRCRVARPAWQGDLLSVEVADTIQRIDLLRRFVRTDAQNSRKAKRESAFVPLRLL